MPQFVLSQLLLTPVTTSPAQLTIVGIIVTLAVIYAAYRIYLALQHLYDPCSGCQGCALKDLKKKGKGSFHKNPPCGDKKNPKTFGVSKEK